MAAIETAIAVAAALGLGSALERYAGGSGERRSARGAVLDALNDLERARWAPRPDAAYDEAARRFQAAALVARLPRDEVMEYLVRAQASRWASVEAGEDDPYSEGGIDGMLADATREAAHAVSEVAWAAGLLARIKRKRRRKRVAASLALVESVNSLGHIKHSREYGVA